MCEPGRHKHKHKYKHKHKPRVNRDDTSTNISTSRSISHVWTGTTQAQETEQEKGARSFFVVLMLASSRFTRGLYLCLCLCLCRACKQTKAPARRGHIVAPTMCPIMQLRSWQNATSCCAPRGHKKCFWIYIQQLAVEFAIYWLYIDGYRRTTSQAHEIQWSIPPRACDVIVLRQTSRIRASFV